MYDVIIIGRGPAGLAATIYLCRADKKVLIIGKENAIWKESVKVNNYFALGDTNGKKLMEDGEKQARKFGAEVINALVTKVEMKKTGFVVLADKEYKSKNLLIATGRAVKKPEIINEKDYVGKGVSYCVACDGFFFKNKKVIVVGNTNFALQEAEDLLDYTKDITIITNGKKPEFKTSKFKVDECKINKIIGEKVIKFIDTSKGEIEVSGVFIASGDAGAGDLARMLGVVMDENGKIKVDANNKTSMEYVWAAGDCTPGLAQISVAVGEGATAATSILKEGRK